MGKVIDKRAEAIVLQEMARQRNLIAWYKALDPVICREASERVEKLEKELLKIRQ